MIPKIIHFIFGLSKDFGGKPFSYIHYLAIKTAQVVHNPHKVYLHYYYEPEGKWWEKAKLSVIQKKFVPKEEIFGNKLMHFAHKADIARLEILQEYGGIYLDLDIISINSFDPLLKYEFVMGREENVGLCNAVILANKDSSFIRIWYEAYRKFDNQKWNEHSVILPLQLAKKNPSLIHIENEYSFFYPMIGDPISNYLWQSNLGMNTKDKFRVIGSKLKSKLQNLDKGINLLPIVHIFFDKNWHYKKLKKSYCTHLWESRWWDKYLIRVSERYIEIGKSNFPKLIRDILKKNDNENSNNY